LAGTYLCFSSPSTFLNATVPFPALAAAHPVDVTPVLQMMMRNLGCLYALFAVNGGVVLRLTRERSVWYAVVLIYAAYCIAPEQMFTPLAWNSDERANYVMLFFGLFMRILFMTGIGRK
ncbi:hypothetical protein LAWI1_G004850, partial [Lachnellula willkommii]